MIVHFLIIFLYIFLSKIYNMIQQLFLDIFNFITVSASRNAAGIPHQNKTPSCNMKMNKNRASVISYYTK